MVCDASWLAGAPSSLPDPYRRSPERLRTFIAHLPFCCISRGSPQHHPDGKKGSPYPQLRRSWAVSQDPSRSISEDKFSVVSYNILGDDNASKHNDLYSHIPSHFLRWDQRKRLIFKEVMVLDPDILCLQEVDRFDDILINMKGRGYVGTFKMRLLLQKAHALSDKWGGLPVVLAGDFNSTPQSAIYKLLTSSKLNLKMYERRQLSGQNSCQTAHSFGMERRQPYRSFKYYWSEEELLIASGDPKCTKLAHPLKLYSSYANVKGSRRPRTRDSTGEPLATTYHSKFIGTVDYIWYSDGLAPQKVLDPLPINILQEMGGLPSQNEGSDHLALACEFAFTEEA